MDDGVHMMHQLTDKPGVSDAGNVGGVFPRNRVEAKYLVLGGKLLGDLAPKLARAPRDQNAHRYVMPTQTEPSATFIATITSYSITPLAQTQI
jgi:hypothetical protein